MPIDFTCGRCGYSREVPIDFALKTVTCPKCKTKGIVPELSVQKMASEVIDIVEESSPPPRSAARSESPAASPPGPREPDNPNSDEFFGGRRYWRLDRRPQRSLRNGVILLFLQVVFIVPFILMTWFSSPKLRTTSSDVVLELTALVLTVLAAISYLLSPFWIASHSKGRGAETPLWCIVGMTPLLGLAMYLIANRDVDLK